jgi:hypothetical protein
MYVGEWNVVFRTCGGAGGGAGGGIVGWSGNNKFNVVIGCITHFLILLV